MKKHVIHTMISVMVIWGIYNPAAALSAEDDQFFVDMINQIRTDPYGYAIGLEYTHETLTAKGIGPDTTFAPYTLDEGLTVMAETESQRMAGEEIAEAEEPSVHHLTTSTGGVVSFFNFMTRETAFKIVIDYLFKEELDTNTFNHILSEECSYAGIAISAGKVGSGNAWFVAISLRSDELLSEIQMLNLINQIRTDPYDYAIGLGYTHETLTANGIGPETTFALYTLDESLTVMAETKSQEMAGEEIMEAEEPPVHRLTTSTGGVVSFLNFMTRETAFKIVIDYLFKEELDTNTFNHILSEECSYAGIAMSAGKVGSENAWCVAISLRSDELISEIQMLNLINQVRSNPENIWEYTNLNRVDVFDLNPNIPELFTVKYKPLFFNASLSASASEAEADLETDAYHGYEGEVVHKSEVGVPCLTEEDSRSVDFLFTSLIRYELNDWPLSPVTFLTDFQDIGSSVAFQPGDKIDTSLDTSVLSFVVGRNDPNSSDDENSTSNDEQMSKIYGILFSDNDGDGLYAPGEELIQKDVTVSVYVDDVDGMTELKTVRTDNAGHFSMTLETNRQYSFVAAIDENVQVAWEGNDGNHSITSDQFVKLVYTPTPPENNILAVDIQ